MTVYVQVNGLLVHPAVRDLVICLDPKTEVCGFSWICLVLALKTLVPSVVLWWCEQPTLAERFNPWFQWTVSGLTGMVQYGDNVHRHTEAIT